jgi:hypothetical protein
MLKKALSIEPTCFCKRKIQASYSMCASVTKNAVLLGNNVVDYFCVH